MTHQEIVDKLAEEFLRRRRNGESVTWRSYAERFPEHAEEIQEVFPALLMVEDLVPSESDATPLGQSPELPKQIGNYRIVRKIGSGGMGVVYEAEQLSLGRRVAIKVLPSHISQDPAVAQRFNIEARSAAKLQHPNIVPVYEVGTDAETAYYVMQLVQGHSLEQVKRELRKLRHGAQQLASSPLHEANVASSLWHGHWNPCRATGSAEGRRAGTPAGPSSHNSPTSKETTDGTDDSSSTVSAISKLSGGSADHHDIQKYFRSVARLGIQVAMGLNYAHRQGVVHRDVKPSNLLLDSMGGIWLTDFGLAKVDGKELTRTGDVVGTVRYMAPERFRGWSDPRSDVYSLGMTLYEMLVLQPAFNAPDRVSLVSQIVSERAKSLRKVDRHIPRDIDTIVARAIDKEPSRRYQHADELANDLQRFLDYRPIRARRTNTVMRTWQWCKRSPALAMASATVFVLLFALAFGGTITSIRLNTLVLKQQLEAESRRQQQYAAEIHAATSAVEEGRFTYAVGLLMTHLPSPGEVDLRSFEWGYLWQRCMDALRVERISTIGQISQKETTEATTSQEKKDFDFVASHPRSAVCTTVFSPDGLRLYVAGEFFLDVFDWASRNRIGRRHFMGWSYDLDVSDDGKSLLIAGGMRKTLVFDTQSLSRRQVEHEGQVFRAKFLPGSAYFFTQAGHASFGSIITEFWNTKTLQPASLEEIEGDLLIDFIENIDDTLIDFSPNGKYVVTYGPMGSSFESAKLTLWDTKRGEPLWKRDSRLAYHRHCSMLLFSPDNRLLATAEPHAVVVRDTERGEILYEFTASREVREMVFSPDCSQLAVSHGGEVVLWDLLTSQLDRALIPHESEVVYALNYTPDGRYLITGGLNSTVLIHDLQRQISDGRSAFAGDIDLTSLRLGRTGEQWFVRRSPGDRTVHQSMLPIAFPSRLKDILGDGEEVFFVKQHRHTALVWLYSNTNSADTDPELQIWNFSTGTRVRLAVPEDFSVPSVPSLIAAFSPDGTEMVTAGGQAPMIWDVATGVLRRRLRQRYSYALAYDRDGSSLAVYWHNNVTILEKDSEADTYQLSREFQTVTGGNAIAFSPDGRWLAAGPWTGSTVVWNLDSDHDEPEHRFSGQAGLVADLEFTPDGKRLLTVAAGQVRMWDLITDRHVATYGQDLERPTDWTNVEFSADGNGTVLTLKARGEQRLQVLRAAHANSVIDDLEFLESL